MSNVELVIGKILRIGVVVSVTVMIIGLVLLLIQGTGGYHGDFFPTAPDAVLRGVVELKPFAIMMLGIFLLILTPVLRVVVSIYAFWKEHDYMYVWITTFVLVVLAVGMISGYLYNK